jgi:serine/threonine-protein kinase
MAHQHGIIHRDIKPDNIFLCPTDEESSTQPFFFCKILDFGIAKQTQLPKMGGLTTEGKIVGTPEFMSPEQVLEEGEVDRRADLWALGVVCYVSLTLCLPFQGKTLGQLCLELANPKPEKVSMLRPELSPQVDAWFARCFHRDSKHRFASAKEMSKSFVTLLSGSDPATLYPSTPMAIQGTVQTRRAKRSVALAAGAIAVGGLLLALAWPGLRGDASSPEAATSEPPSGEASTTPPVTAAPVTTSSAPAKASPTASGSTDSPAIPARSTAARSRPAKPPARLPRRSPPPTKKPAKAPNRKKSDRRGEEQLGF